MTIDDAIKDLEKIKKVKFSPISQPVSMDMAIDALKATRWIPVSEQLPEEYTRVIGFMAWKAMTAIEYQNGKWYSIDHLEPLPDEAVTHWMPLPEPPKEE